MVTVDAGVQDDHIGTFAGLAVVVSHVGVDPVGAPRDGLADRVHQAVWFDVPHVGPSLECLPGGFRELPGDRSVSISNPARSGPRRQAPWRRLSRASKPSRRPIDVAGTAAPYITISTDVRWTVSVVGERAVIPCCLRGRHESERDAPCSDSLQSLPSVWPISTVARHAVRFN